MSGAVGNCFLGIVASLHAYGWTGRPITCSSNSALQDPETNLAGSICSRLVKGRIDFTEERFISTLISQLLEAPRPEVTCLSLKKARFCLRGLLSSCLLVPRSDPWAGGMFRPPLMERRLSISLLTLLTSPWNSLPPATSISSFKSDRSWRGAGGGCNLSMAVS